ncbi:aldolase/citrate lyase family protein [soil metagenome]
MIGDNAASTLVAETLGSAGYDFVIVDLQHGENNLDNAQHMFQALGNTAAMPFVRVAAGVPMYIQRALDLGAYGVIVPSVNNEEEAAQIVSSVRYAPAGTRSWGPVRGLLYGGTDYFSKSSAELLTLVMIESAEGLKNVDEIMNVDGVDGCFVGPMDLGISLGHSPDLPKLPEQVDEAIAKILAATRAAGKFAGIHTTSVDDAKRRIEQGFRLVSVMADTRMMKVGAMQTLAALK